MTPHPDMAVPKIYQEFQDHWAAPHLRQTSLALYQQGRRSFVPNLLPEQAVALSGAETLDILSQRFGEAVGTALSLTCADPDNLPAEMPPGLRSPVAGQPHSHWLKQTNMVGINVRTIGSFWNIVKYALTLPAAQGSIHILPIWEAGVVGSMYGMSSWLLNHEFYSAELANLVPALSTIDRQLRAVVNLLHLMGKAVGMDVIPHTDRFSQIALAFPEYFEWLQRQDVVIVDHSANLHEAVQAKIIDFLRENGPAVTTEALPPDRESFFNESVPETQRVRVLFGLPNDKEGRETRRNALINYLYRYGYEPAPGTMAPPYRGLAVDRRPEAVNVDAHGQVWRDYVISNPQPMSRVFGPLGRYKLYESKNNNLAWEIDFSRPRKEVWRYVCENYYQMQRRFGFDFMRGDMSHVQMRPEGVPPEFDDYYDILGAVKDYIQHTKKVPYFGYFAETFLAPRNTMSYGEEIDHLEASLADTTLGDLQSTVVGTPEFLQRLRRYLDLLHTRACTPNFTVMTADKDDPRFDEFYRQGNDTRLFIALFLTDMPSYMGLGFETRDAHYDRAPNEHYTKLYVFQESEGPKATHGPYVWGQNGVLFSTVTRMRLWADALWPIIKERPVRWLLPPDATGQNKLLAWTQADAVPDYLFVANTNITQAIDRFTLPRIPGVEAEALLEFEFSTARTIPDTDQVLTFNGHQFPVTRLAPGEGRIYRIENL